MTKRILYIIKIYLLTVMIAVIAKLVFMIYNSPIHTLTMSDIAAVIGHGISLDLSTSIYIVLVPFAVTVVSIWWNSGWNIMRMVLKTYYAVISTAMAVLFVCDTCLYEYWGFKLNSTALSYLESPQGITSSVSWTYIAIRTVVCIISAIVIYKLFDMATPKQSDHSGRPATSSSDRFIISALPLKHRIISTIVAVAAVPLIVIGIRGGVTESTTNVGQVYFSQNQFLNHAAVNPLFSFISSFKHGAKDYDIYNYYDEARLHKLVSGIYNTESTGTDTLLNTTRPNVVIILLESCGGVFTEIGGRNDITPNLNRIAHEGIYFSQCYANSWRTDRGTVCTLSGYPSFPQASVMKMPDKSRTMPSIAASLQREGYRTTFLYGGDINFTNMRSYLIGTGFEKLISMDNYTKEEQASAQWGVRDDITFSTLYDLITVPQTDAGPFIIGYSTLSSHEPWDVPQKHFDDEVLNAFFYLDKCVGDFIDRLRRTPAWNDLLIVMLPDHGIRYKDLDNTQLLYNHIPMIWTGGAVKAPRTVTQICNQTDLAATLLGQMGISHDEYTFSRDVLSSSYRYPTAMNTFNNGFMFTDSTGYIVYDLNADRIAAGNSSAPERLTETGKAILQVTSADLKNR